MSLMSSDAILQRIADENAKSNDHLKSMRELLMGIDKNNAKSNNTTSKAKNKTQDKQNPFSKALKDVFGEAKGLSSTVLGNNGSIQNTIGALGTSANVLSSSFSKLPGPIGLVAGGFMQLVSAGSALYDYMNQQLQMYNELNSSGVLLSQGMITARKGAAGAFLSLNEFQGVLQKNSDALAAMDSQYGNGVEEFGRLLNAVQLAQKSAGLYGVSQQQLADITAKNFKYNKMFSSQQQLQKMNEAQSTQQFIGTLTYLSKTVGKSIDELLGKFNDMGTNLDTGVAARALQERFGQSEDMAADVTKSFNSVFASMGEAGTILQHINSNKLDMGILPDEYVNEFTQLYTDRLMDLQASGMTDPKEIRKKMSEFVKINEKRLDDEIKYQNRVGNVAAAGWLTQIKNYEKMVNDPKNNPTPIYENMMNRFNLWIGENFTEPFNTFFANSQESLATYLTSIADSTDNAFDFMAIVSKDAYDYLNNAMGGWLNVPGKIFDSLTETLYGENYNKIKNSFEELYNSILSVPKELVKTLWAWISGGDIEQASGDLRIAIKMMFGDIGTAVKNILSVDMDFKGAQERIAKAFNTMKDKLFKFWDNISNWWNTDDSQEIDNRRANIETKKQQIQSTDPKVQGKETVQKPEFTKPEKIEEQKEQSSTDITSENDLISAQRAESTNKLLSSILNNLEGQTSLNNQTLAALRQITENTEPPRNV